VPEPYKQEQHTYQIPPRNETEFNDGDEIHTHLASPDLLSLDEARARSEAADALRRGEKLSETAVAIQQGMLLQKWRREEFELAA